LATKEEAIEVRQLIIGILIFCGLMLVPLFFHFHWPKDGADLGFDDRPWPGNSDPWLSPTQSLLILAGIVATAICSGLGAYVSTQKGRPAWEGAIFGLLLGPLRVIAAACLPTQGKHPQ
jgi:hypothetical protein